MKITRLYTNPNGESRFEDMDIPLEDSGEIGRLSAFIPVTGVIFRETEPDYDYDWHPAPRRQFIVMLQGVVEIETGMAPNAGSVRETFFWRKIQLAEGTAAAQWTIRCAKQSS